MAEFTRNLAVVIGINQYDGGIAPLQTAANDATTLAQILKEKHNYQVRLWVNEQATLTNLNRLFEELLPKTVTEGDRLLFYFAGHGIALNGEDGPEGYLIPQDARLGKVDSYLPMSELNQALAKLPCRHFLAVLDCCFAGAFRWSSNRDVSTVPEVIHKERYDRFIQDSAWQVITSAAHDQKALDILALRDRTGSTNKHSPFAAALMDALSGEADSSPPARDGKPAGDGVITATELYLYLRDEVEHNTENSTKRQTPGLWCLKNHDKGEYIFLTPGHALNLPPAPPLDVSKNPYRGLASFEEEHSNLFFGRSALTARLQEFVVQHPLIVVLGASGSGKSSLVKAGLIPYLKQLHQTQETQEQWKILGPIRPGESPLTALQSALKGSISPLADVLAQEVELDEKTLASGIANWKQQHPDTKLLLVIDQFEELVTLCRDEVQREQFLKLLAHVLNSCSDQFHLLLTLRSDFEPQFRDTPLEGYWKDTRFVVAAMTREELREAIEEPASLRVIHFEPHNLVDQLIDEVAQMPGALPLLSFALSELYLKYLQRQDKARNRLETIDRAITQGDYNELGGVTRSLTQRADQEYEALIKQDLAYAQTIRNVMLRMVAIGGELARRRVSLLELEYLGSENTRVKNVIHQFSEARLLTSGTDSEDQPYVEPAHDALIRGWQKLLNWKKEEQENLILQRQLTPAAKEWADEQMQTRFLWNANPRIDLLRRLLSFDSNWFNQVEVEFVKRSIKQKRRNVSIRWSITVAVILGLSTLTVLSLIGQRNVLIEQIRTLRQSSEILLFGNQQLDALMTALEAGGKLEAPLLQLVKVDNQLETQIIDSLQKILSTVQERNRWIAHQDNVLSLYFSPDGKTLASAGDDGTVRLWEISGEQFGELKIQISSENSLSFSPDGELLAIAERNGTIRLWKVRGQQLSQFNLDATSSIRRISFSSDGKYILVDMFNEAPSLWNLQGARIPLSYSSDSILSIMLTTNNEGLIATYQDRGVIALQNLQGNQLAVFNAFQGWHVNTAFSPNGEQLITEGATPEVEGRFIYLWNLSGQKVMSIPGHDDWVTKTCFSSDGKLLATAGSVDDTVRLWDLKSESELTEFQAGQLGIASISCSPDGNLLATGGNDGSIRLWDWRNRVSFDFLEEQHFSPEHQDQVLNATLSSDGQLLAVSEANNTVRIWNLQTQRNLAEITVNSGSIWEVVFSADSNLLAIGNTNGKVSLWDWREQQELGEFQGKSQQVSWDIDPEMARLKAFPSPLWTTNFSKDNRLISVGTANDSIEIWDWRNRQQLTKLQVDQGWIDRVIFSSNNEYVTTISRSEMYAEQDSIIQVWDLQGKQLLEFTGSQHWIGSSNYSPTGEVLATGDEDGVVRLWSLSGQKIAEFKVFNSLIYDLTFSSDSKYLAIVDGSGAIKVWDLESEEQVIEMPKQEEFVIADAVFSSDNRKLIITNTDGTARTLGIPGLSELMKSGCSWVSDYLKHNGDQSICHNFE